MSSGRFNWTDGFQLLDLRMETIGQCPLDVKCVLLVCLFSTSGRLDGNWWTVGQKPQDGRDDFQLLDLRMEKVVYSSVSSDLRTETIGQIPLDDWTDKVVSRSETP